ncbi:MAG: FtsX-like permease family protein, partial [Gemmatimonadetes bacterium]|nr:FtsX-like permease family protein [Gemmatimonadota bacterium]
MTEALVDPANRKAILILFGAVGILVLIACANTANLLLVRAAAREREIAVRLAVGSDQWHLVRFLLAESALLSGLGAAVGILLAYAGINALSPFLPPRGRVGSGAFVSISEFYTPTLDLAVLGFTCAVAVLTAVLFGLLPAWRATRVAPVEALKSGGRSGTPARRETLGLDVNGAFTAGQIALAVVLLAGDGLLLRSLWRLQSLPRGFDPTQVVTFHVQAPVSWYRPSDAPALVERVIGGVSRVPGVEAAAASFYAPFGGHARHDINLAGTGNQP